ncbi:CRP/FNR family transcriptional regulator [Melghirimyces profundicolus]|uniref:CRP/FNR family transcriptional regulator n=1 Tax=Melghirimyces profundicolus TaxID=1242148 RepID=A0A2T6BQ90_9BACL|nr:Crp/Fnr family transcriptional regulator [Melghirimyces profundicolus]PTX58260.1 CRP/FNR family transcriptional regulator [Melghirimyces profundicolus]
MTDAFLKKIGLFREVEEPVLEWLQNSMIQRKYSKGNTVFFRGEEINRLFIVRAGRIRLSGTDPEGHRLFRIDQLEGDWFPKFGFFHPATFLWDAQATEETTLLVLPAECIREGFDTSPPFARSLLRGMSLWIASLEEQLKEMAVYQTRERLTSLLLRLGTPPDRNGWSRIPVSFTHREMAQMIGSSRETVNRLIARLTAENILRWDKGTWMIHVGKADCRINGQHDWPGGNP